MTTFAAPGQTAASVRLFAANMRERAAQQEALAATAANASRATAHTQLATHFAGKARSYEALAAALEKEPAA